MQLHLEGSTTIKADRQKVFDLLTDPNFLARSLPDAEEVRVIDGENLEARMKLKIAVVSSTLGVKMAISDKTPPSRARLMAVANGSGSSMNISSVFELNGDLPTTMSWSADAEITGVVSGLGSTLLKGFATKKVAEIFEGITRSIEGESQQE